jgi:hypothetical protein
MQDITFGWRDTVVPRMEQGHTYASVGDSHRAGLKVGIRFARLQQGKAPHKPLTS